MSVNPSASEHNQTAWTHASLEQVILVLRQSYAIDVAVFDAAFMLKSLAKRQALTACASPPDYIQRLVQSPDEANALHRSLIISYSSFFRNPLTFAMLAEFILPRLVDARMRAGQSGIRIWSAGCAAGQEAWSVAMLLDNLADERGHPIPFQIIATDICSDALAMARQGVYDADALHNTPLKFVRRYLSTTADTYIINHVLRKHVDFSVYDLLDETSTSPAASIYGDFDLILCSNVLFYYRMDVRQRILDKLCGVLNPDGYFVTGETERENVSGHKNLFAVPASSAIFQKSGRRTNKAD